MYNNGIGASGSIQAHFNTAIGSKSLYANTTGNYNTGTGYAVQLVKIIVTSIL
jgi:hypothetical protein